MFVSDFAIRRPIVTVVTMIALVVFGLASLARLDTDHTLARAGLAFGVSLGSQDLAGLVATAPGDAGRIDAVDLYGVSTRRFTHSRGVRD